jgi:hypothetical protein
MPHDERADIAEGYLTVIQVKTKQPLRIVISGKLQKPLERIRERKRTHKTFTVGLLVNEWGKRLTAPVIRNYFGLARKAAAKASPEFTGAIEKFWLYDLRAKAADDIKRCSW